MVSVHFSTDIELCHQLLFAAEHGDLMTIEALYQLGFENENVANDFVENSQSSGEEMDENDVFRAAVAISQSKDNERKKIEKNSGLSYLDTSQSQSQSQTIQTRRKALEKEHEIESRALKRHRRISRAGNDQYSLSPYPQQQNCTPLRSQDISSFDMNLDGRDEENDSDGSDEF